VRVCGPGLNPGVAFDGTGKDIMKKDLPLFLTGLVVLGLAGTPLKACQWSGAGEYERTVAPARVLSDCPVMRGMAKDIRTRPNGETVSVARLRHQPPAKARAAFQRAARLGRAGQWMECAAELEHAVSLDPKFADAYANLAVCYTRVEKLEQAVAMARKAVDLDQGSATSRANLAILLLEFGRRSEAEAEVRAALSLNSGNAVAQYLLGSLLAARPETRATAIRYLENSVSQVPDAHYALATVFRAQGDEAAAREQMALYERALNQQQSN
jgi:tetratricopeptide (TPR) repeat protein